MSLVKLKIVYSPPASVLASKYYIKIAGLFNVLAQNHIFHIFTWVNPGSFIDLDEFGLFTCI